MRYVIMAATVVLTTSGLNKPAYADEVVGVVMNPETNVVQKIIVRNGAEPTPYDLRACGSSCEFVTLLEPGQCVIVSISSTNTSWGYQLGDPGEGSFMIKQSKSTCQHYGGHNCQPSGMICN